MGIDKNKPDELQGEGTLNLGLSDLLEKAFADTRADDSLQVENGAQKPEDEPLREVQQSEYERLAASQEWTLLSSICEKEIAEKGDSFLEAQLWWLKVQLVTGAVPANILSAPMESASRLLEKVIEGGSPAEIGSNLEKEKVNKLASLASEVIITASADMKESAERLTVVVLLERALAFTPAHADVIGAVFKTLKEEIARGRPKGKIENLRWTEENKELLDRVKHLEEKLNLEEQELKPVVSNKGDSETPERKLDNRMLFSIFGKLDQFSLNRKYRLLTALFIFTIALSYTWVLFSGPTRAESIGVVSLGELPVAQLKTPDLQVFSRLSNLDAIFYDINSAEQNPGSTQRGSYPAQSSASESVASASVPVSQTRTVQAQEREVVNTQGPLEPASVRDIRRRASSDNQSLRVDAVERGSAAFGHEVENLPANTHYRIARTTPIMTTPSLFAGSIAELNRGDTVLVEARIGNWLRLRSKSGEAGYIHIEDADRVRT